MFRTPCDRATKIACAAAIPMLAGSAPASSQPAELWGALAPYEYEYFQLHGYPNKHYEGYGVAFNAPSMAEALAAAMERCREEELKVPAHVREDPQAVAPNSRRCDGTNPAGFEEWPHNRWLFSTSVPAIPGTIHYVFPAVHATHGRCIVIMLEVSVGSDPLFIYTVTNDAPEYVAEQLEFYGGLPHYEGEVELISCNDR